MGSAPQALFRQHGPHPVWEWSRAAPQPGYD